MKLSLIIAALVATSTALVRQPAAASKRQSAAVVKRHDSGVATPLKDDTIATAAADCKDIIFIFARGSTEPKPLV
jgi:hypothetical protein